MCGLRNSSGIDIPGGCTSRPSHIEVPIRQAFIGSSVYMLCFSAIFGVKTLY